MQLADSQPFTTSMLLESDNLTPTMFKSGEQDGDQNIDLNGSAMDGNAKVVEISSQFEAPVPLHIPSLTNKSIETIAMKVEEVFSKLQRNLEHNTRVFQDKSQTLLAKIEQAEDQLRKVLAQLDQTENNNAVDPTDNAINSLSIALSDDVKINTISETDA